jgi:hypothetical protein
MAIATPWRHQTGHHTLRQRAETDKQSASPHDHTLMARPYRVGYRQKQAGDAGSKIREYLVRGSRTTAISTSGIDRRIAVAVLMTMTGM